MVRTITLLGIVCIHVHSAAQNLVPNAGFEEHDECTQGVDWPDLHDWTIPSLTQEPHYYHECNNGTIADGLGVPYNFIGYQNAHQGVGYVAATVYVRHHSYAHQKLTTHLTQVLQAGQTYCIQFWLSLADSSEARCNLLHGLFTDTLPSAFNGQDSLWAEQAQVTFATDQTDTTTWHLVEAQYIAAGGEEYFTFGNFLPDTLTDVTFPGPIYLNSRSMFYVDDVYVGSCDVGVSESSSAFTPRLWPNPVQRGQAINVGVGTNAGEIAWTMRDGLGRVIVTGRTTSSGRGAFSIPSSAYALGVYVLELWTSECSRTVSVAIQ